MTPPAVAPRQVGPQVWRGADLREDSSWIIDLEPAEIEALLTASAPYATGDDDLPHLSAADFPVPALRERLARLRRELIDGRGFALVRGLPIREVSRRQAAALFMGLGAHLGSARSQNAAGHLLGHVRDLGLDTTDPSVRIYQTNERQTFHTDSTDVVGLLCLETAAAGGESLLVSAAAVYNEVLERDPELAAALFEPVATDRRGEIPPGADPWFEIPVLSWHRGHLTVLYQRQYIESAERLADAPRLTPTQRAALDLFDEIANDPELVLPMALEPGDMQLVHNHSLLHDRTEFTNKPHAPRHLLRLWLSIPGDRPLPPVFAQRYGSLTAGDRGGIVTDATVLCAPLAPTR